MKRLFLSLLGLVSGLTMMAQEYTPDWELAGGNPGIYTVGNIEGEHAGLDVLAIPDVGAGPNRFSSVTLGDLDNDGDLDIISGGTNYGRIFYIENTGTASAPHWENQALYSIDTIANQPHIVSETSTKLQDIDADGDLDLFVGQRWNTAGTHKFDDIVFYRNVGTITTPEFDRQTLPGLAMQEMSEFPSFDFVDIDNDNDFDMVGMGSDSIQFLLNVGTATMPAFERKFGAENPFEPADQPDMLGSTPIFKDYDEDGDYDLYYMADGGYIRYLKNIGTPTNPLFTNAVITPYPLLIGTYRRGDIADVNNDGIDDVVAGNLSPAVFSWYRGKQQVQMISAEKFSNGQIIVTFNQAIQVSNAAYDVNNFKIVVDGSIIPIISYAPHPIGNTRIVLNTPDLSGITGAAEVLYTSSNNVISSTAGNSHLAPNSTQSISGITITSYNNGVWSNGTPNETLIAIVDQDFTTTADMNFYTLTINEGKKIHLDGHKATIEGDLVLKNGAAILDEGTLDVKGDVRVERAVESLLYADFHLMCSPISDGNIEATFQGSYVYRFTGAEYTNIYSFDHGATIRNGEGLSVSGSNTSGVTRVFEGNVNKDAFQYNLISTGAWHLVGNPYPAPMDLAAFYTQNSAGIKPNIYFYNENTGTFDVWNASMSVGTGSATGYASVTQGFFVEEQPTNPTTISYTPSMRSLQADNFLRTADQGEMDVRVQLNGTETLLHWSNEGITAVDANDASFLQGLAPQALYSLQDEQVFALQSRSNDFGIDQIPLGFYSTQAGVQKIDVPHSTDGLLVFLLDKQLEQTHDFANGAYEFMHSASTEMVNDRFEMIVVQSSLSQTELEQNFVVTGGDQISVRQTSSEMIGAIRLYNVAGHMVADFGHINHNTFVKHADYAAGVYFVEIASDKGVSRHKIVIN